MLTIQNGVYFFFKKKEDKREIKTEKEENIKERQREGRRERGGEK